MQPTADLILIVDDNQTNLEVVSEILTDAGYEVAIAMSGERALHQIQYSNPDLILLDIMMPGIDGFHTCERIKQNPAWASIPIIFMTALTDAESKVKGLKLGAVDYITKPFQEQEVLARVETHIRLRKTELSLRQSEARMESILNSLEEVVWSANRDLSEFIYLNPAVKDIFGCSAEDLIAQPQLWFEMVHSEDREYLKREFHLLQEQPTIDQEYRIINTAGEIRWIKIRAQKILDEKGAVFERIDGVLHDISDRKKIESQLFHEAYHDNLTGLPNRINFIYQSNQLLEVLQESPNESFAVLFIDLDRFKHINDSLGHHYGDVLLTQVANRLEKSVRPSDVIARLGGDEFTVLLKRVTRPEDAIVVAERMQQRLAEAIAIEDQVFFTSASIGIVMANEYYTCAEELLRDADIAMYQAKKHGKSGWQLFDHSMHEDSLRKLELERDLRLALTRQEITLNYQPIIDLENPNRLGFEALARWIHPQKGFVSPADFIQIAEESGLIEPLGEYILRQACTQLQQWTVSFPHSPYLTISVNLSGKQLQGRKFIDTLDQILAETSLSVDQLKLEITESILMDNHEHLLDLLHQIIDRGIALSLDDFGTGYSSLSYLHRFPLSELKIDRSFISRLEDDSQSKAIVNTIITLAKSLNMGVVAEGVETREQLEYLKQLKCKKAQGYFYSKPLKADEVESWLMQLPQSNIAV